MGKKKSKTIFIPFIPGSGVAACPYEAAKVYHPSGEVKDVEEVVIVKANAMHISVTASVVIRSVYREPFRIPPISNHVKYDDTSKPKRPRQEIPRREQISRVVSA